MADGLETVMADVARSVQIAASPDSVFRYVVTEWEGDLDFWEDGIEGWRLLTPPPLKTGARVEYTGRMLGIGFPVRMEVRSFEPGKGWSAHSIEGPPVRGDWRFEPADAGTRFTYRLRYTMPPPVLGPILDRWLMEPRWRRAIEASLNNLKGECERRVSG
jgi:hypothetical protein